jgi:hypothetical protein
MSTLFYTTLHNFTQIFITLDMTAKIHHSKYPPLTALCHCCKKLTHHIFSTRKKQHLEESVNFALPTCTLSFIHSTECRAQNFSPEKLKPVVGDRVQIPGQSSSPEECCREVKIQKRKHIV